MKRTAYTIDILSGKLRHSDRRILLIQYTRQNQDQPAFQIGLTADEMGTYMEALMNSIGAMGPEYAGPTLAACQTLEDALRPPE